MPLVSDPDQRVVFFTGAGLSRESGVPTYRGVGGTWHAADPRRVASQEAFDRDPEAVWDFHDERRRLMGSVAPSMGHLLIAELARRHSHVRVVTQNIDGLHQRAGSEGVIELHGSIWRVRCEREGRTWEDLTAPIGDRRCPCGAWLRPDIVWFGDPLDEAALASAIDAVTACDVLVSVGTSGVVYPAAELPRLALRAGARLVEVNPEETALSGLFHEHHRTTASEGLSRLL